MVWVKKVRQHAHASADDGGVINTPAATITSLTVAALVAVGSVITLAGGLAVTGALSAGNVTSSSMTVTGAIAAGSVGIGTAPVAGYPARLRAGDGLGGGTLPVLLYSVYSGSNTVGHPAGAQMDAAVYTVPANTLKRVGDSLHVFCVAIATSSSITKNLDIDFDGDDMAFGATTTTNSSWNADAVATYSAPGNLVGTGRRTRGATASAAEDTILATNMTADFNVSCQLRSTQAAQPVGEPDMTLLTMQVWFYPAPL